MKIERRSITLAREASRCIAEAKKGDNAAEIRHELDAAPARIRQNGLMQTLLYYLEENKDDRNAVGKWLFRHLAPKARFQADEVIKLCDENLMWATDETVEYLRWLKLLAKAELPRSNPTSTDSRGANRG